VSAGPNGCGKTTLLRCLGGALCRQRGRVLLDGVDLFRHSFAREPACRGGTLSAAPVLN